MEEPERLHALFLQSGCPGIASLVNYLSPSNNQPVKCTQIGSSSWIDNEHLLDEITLAMSHYGFGHLPAYPVECGCGKHREWHKHLYIGGRATTKGEWISPLDWLTLFSCHINEISPKALNLFDRGCAGFVDFITAPCKPLDITNL